jgi:Xaa-Pro aminopeptidase
MAALLLYDSGKWSPYVLHEVGIITPDPVIFLEYDGKRIIAGSVLEATNFAARSDVADEFWSYEELSIDELVRAVSFPNHLIGPELVFRAVARSGAHTVTVPPTFHVAVADHLRERGVEVDVNSEVWEMRRRRKKAWQLAGVERAQRAAEAAMRTAARMLREAGRTAGFLQLGGSALTAERIREEMSRELLAHGAESNEIMVQSGDACLEGHELGTGPILPDASCIIDCYPRDRQSGVYTDITRTYVPGRPSEELRRLHADCRAALQLALETTKPGTRDAYPVVAEFFERKGYPTLATYQGEEPLGMGFNHALGHGVGLEVHERPFIGRRSEDFVEGEVVAVEPGLYFPGVGGVRLEDTVLVTAEGTRHFTEPLSYDLEP